MALIGHERLLSGAWGTQNWRSTVFLLLGNLFSRNSELTSVNLAENSIRTLPELISNLHKLKQLLLHTNNIESIPKDFFKNSPGLQRVELQNNNIQSIPPKTFRSSSTWEMRTLFLQNNWIGELKSKSVGHIKIHSEIIKQFKKLTGKPHKTLVYSPTCSSLRSQYRRQQLSSFAVWFDKGKHRNRYKF